MILYYRKNPREPWRRVAECHPDFAGVEIRARGVQTGEYVGLVRPYGEMFWSLLSLEHAARKGYGRTILFRPTRAKRFFAGWRQEMRGGRATWVRRDPRQMVLGEKR